MSTISQRQERAAERSAVDGPADLHEAAGPEVPLTITDFAGRYLLTCEALAAQVEAIVALRIDWRDRKISVGYR